jgi:hypothetical protein
MKTNLMNFLIHDHQDEEEGVKVLFTRLHFGLKKLGNIKKTL